MESRPSPADMPGPYMPPTETSPPQQPKQMAAVTVPISPSPIFLLFLTCLHHIVQQHPNRFEYNDYLLVLLARAAGGFSPFGDFLYNNEKERAQDRLRQRTPSIWKWIQENQGWFTNRDYASGTDPASKHPDAWRANVLHIQTGGRFSSLWSEYYFNTTPVWFPDPRSVLSTASTFAECNLNQPLLSLRRQLVLSADPFYASQFDQHQIQQLAFPGLSTNRTQQHPLCNDRRSTVMTIPPSLALLEGQDMHLYYLLVQRLRDRRKERLQQAFLNWKSWAKRRREEKPAREAGWRLMSGVSGSNSSQDDSLVDGPDDGEDFGGESEDEDFTLSSRRCAPELKVVVAAKGIEAAMERMLEGRPFFGEGSLVYDDQDSDNEMFFTREGAIRGSASGKDRDLAMLDEDGLEGAFDDFGFPVNTDDSEVVVV
ncbi:Myotubularin- protein 2 [Dissophora globulifera]|uniref:Myotubularin- protein 2 n=1 Tax=Dissophora globulifera TaxID=979702 RepID=A0A9P6UXV7_9FUNG|nr:Myotubularin- protein 2 [Dissophora globulifera]